MKQIKVLLLLITLLGADLVSAYPIDGYLFTGIRRLFRLQFILDGKIKDTKPIAGALKSIKDIKLNLTNEKGDSLNIFEVDYHLIENI